MKIFNSETFKYIDNDLHCEETRLADIASRTGTPVYVYSKDILLKDIGSFSMLLKKLALRYFFLQSLTLI